MGEQSTAFHRAKGARRPNASGRPAALSLLGPVQHSPDRLFLQREKKIGSGFAAIEKAGIAFLLFLLMKIKGKRAKIFYFSWSWPKPWSEKGLKSSSVC